MNKAKLEIIVTMPDGVVYSETIAGEVAAAGLDTLLQWMADQNQNPGNIPDFKPKYSNPAFAIKSGIVQTVLRLAERFPSKALEAETAALEAARQAVENKRKALAGLAFGESK